MKGGTRAGLALAAGYVLGRRHKLRTAALLGAAVASGRLGALGATAIKRGTSAGGSGALLGKVSPQLGGIADKVRGELVNAGKAAAMAAVSNKIENFSDSIHQRADAIRGPGQSARDDDDADDDQSDAEDGDPEDRDQREDDYRDDARGEYDEDEPDDVDDEYEDDDVDDEYEDDDVADEYEQDDDEPDDVDEPESSGSRGLRGSSRSPVSRTGR